MDIREAYAKKLSVSEKVYAKEHGSRSMPESKRIAVARVLANTSAYITEAYANSDATQLSAMKTNKKFCMDLTTVALPSLISNELAIVYPMKSRTGFIQYLEFVASTDKGGITKGTMFNNPFKLGEMNDSRVNYTAATVVETVNYDGTNVAYFMWQPVVAPVVDNKHPDIIVKDSAGNTLVEGTNYTIVTTDSKIGINNEAGQAYIYNVAYKYDNVIIPQNDIPTVGARVSEMALTAKARRVQIYYSQMAAFQAKTEMGIDLGEVLTSQACGELSYETDTEVVKLIVDGAGDVQEGLKFDTTCPIGVSIRDHYAAFANIIEKGSQIIYDRTQRHAANYMIASSSIKPVLALMEGWKAANTSKINGPYYAGEFNGVKVFISPAIAAGEFVLGYNGGDFTTSAVVYAPYMMIVPTQLLGYADGAMNQGFSTLYDAKLLNAALLVKGQVTSVGTSSSSYVSGTLQTKAVTA